MAFTDTVDRELLDHFLATYDLWAGYSTADPGKDGTSVAEPAGATGYARVQIDSDVARTNSEIDNDAAIEFPEATDSQGEITYACLFDGEAGDIIWYGELTTPKTITSGKTPRFPAGDFNVTQS